MAPEMDGVPRVFWPPTNATSAGAYTACSRGGPGTQLHEPLMLAQRP